MPGKTKTSSRIVLAHHVHDIHLLEIPEKAGLHNHGLLAKFDGTTAGASSLEGLDDLHRVIINDLAEDDVAAVEPASLHGRDEELRAVAVKRG